LPRAATRCSASTGSTPRTAPTSAHGGDVEAYKAKLQQHLDILRGRNDTSKAHTNEIARTEGKIAFLSDAERNPGHLYQVAIDHPRENFLDWDKPLSEQSPFIRDAIAKADAGAPTSAPPITAIKDPAIRNIVRSAMRQNDGEYAGLDLVIDNDSALYQAAVKHAKSKGIDLDASDMSPSDYIYQQAKEYLDALHGARQITGDTVYQMLGRSGGGMMQGGAATEKLKKAGIPGIRYLDQASRGDGKGTHNYVTFDAPRILRKYGIPISAGGFGALAYPRDDL
jgi:hypothetical protein